MLRFVKLGRPRPSARTITPALMEPLLDSSLQVDELVPVVRTIVRGLGFDSFLCGWGSASRPDRDSTLYAFTTLPQEWATLYEREHYVEVDPRIQLSEEAPAMLYWSADELRGVDRGRDKFFNDAAKFGIRSGVCFGWRDAEGNGLLCGYNSSADRVDPTAIRHVVHHLYAFGHAFHDVFMRTVIEKGVPSRLRGVALTKRETEALKYAARGLTVLDIAPKMGISPRTVRFHIDKATTKLGALKREETIALAVKGGLLDVLP